MEKQLSFFEFKEDIQNKKIEPQFTKKKLKSVIWTVFTDGACRGNPGPSGAGIYIESEALKLKKSFYLGNKTNNQAEYLALALAVFILKNEFEKQPKLSHTLKIVCDSELLVRQIKGVYKIKDSTLKSLKNLISFLLSGVVFEVKHVLREKNKIADSLANKAVDEKKDSLPKEFSVLLKKFEVIF